MKTTSVSDHPVHAAGRLWTIAEVTLTELPDGTTAISKAELTRIHRAIANDVCGKPDTMTGDELEFLCDITDTPYAEVARFLDIDRSTITLWRRKGSVSKRITSLLLKRWFWFRIFGDEMAATRLPLSSVGDEELLLRKVHQAAIKADMTFAVQAALVA